MRSRPKQQPSFSVCKRNALSKLDKSPKGSIDAPIAALIAAINEHDDYVTTSSCSGRIALFETAVDDQRGRWLLVEHAPVTRAQVEAALAAPAADAASRLVTFKHEPAIVHVQCRDLPAAERLLHAGLRAGFRESGIVLSASCKVMLALRTTANCLELPLVVRGEALLPAHALDVLVEHANSKFAANLARLQRLSDAYGELSRGVPASPVVSLPACAAALSPPGPDASRGPGALHGGACAVQAEARDVERLAPSPDGPAG